VANFGNYDAVYGALGFVIVLMVFAYLSAQIMLLGAELTHSYVEVRTGVAAPEPPAPKQPMSVARIEEVVKGLFVAAEPHHDEAKPHEPVRPDAGQMDQEARQRC
jgi:membrane protein